MSVRNQTGVSRIARCRVAPAFIGASLALLAIAFTARGQCRYAVTLLPNSGCFGGPLNPVAINNLGHVLLTGANCGEPFYGVSYLWTGGNTLQSLPIPPGHLGAKAVALNDLDEIVGYVTRDISPPGGSVINVDEACLWRNGEPILLGIPAGGSYSTATGINNHSEICGYWGNYNTGQPPFRAFVRRKGVRTDLPLPAPNVARAFDISDDGTVCGATGSAAETLHAFRWRDGAYADLGSVPGGLGGQAQAIAENGRIAGWGVYIAVTPYIKRAAIWQNDVAALIPVLRGTDSAIANDTNMFVTVGYCYVAPSSNSRGFLFQEANLCDLVASIDLSGITRFVPAALNETGQIIGSGLTSQQATMLLTPLGNAPADITRNCRVDVNDLLTVISEWGKQSSVADIDHNGDVDVLDLMFVIEQWGS